MQVQNMLFFNANSGILIQTRPPCITATGTKNNLMHSRSCTYGGCVHVCVCVYMCAWVYVCMFVCVYERMCVYMCICVSI